MVLRASPFLLALAAFVQLPHLSRDLLLKPSSVGLQPPPPPCSEGWVAGDHLTGPNSSNTISLRRACSKQQPGQHLATGTAWDSDMDPVPLSLLPVPRSEQHTGLLYTATSQMGWLAPARGTCAEKHGYCPVQL